MRKTILFIALAALAASSSLAKDKSHDYQIGTYVTVTAVDDGTFTDRSHCIVESGATTCFGDAGFNQVSIYQISVPDGIWRLETEHQADDTRMREHLGDPAHFTKEKPTPLDFLKNGDQVLFRCREATKDRRHGHRRFHPYADKPDKEAKFLGEFTPASPRPVPAKPTDNVKAMCEAHKLAPELEAKYCAPASPANSETAVNPKSTHAEEQPHSAEEYPAQLIGKRFNVQRLPLCQPGTYKGDFVHAGQQATVVSAKPNTMMPALSAMSAITPELRAMIEDQQKAATLLLQFEDGTKLDTCAPIGPKWLANYVELARAESPKRASN